MNGISGTAMPYFKRALESAKIWDVTNYVMVTFIGYTDSDLVPGAIDASYENIWHNLDIQPEFRIGKSRLDFRLILEDGQNCFVEVKGCTLTKNGKALFPDAPTIRGARHLRELISLKKNGHRSAVILLVLGPSAACFSPNGETDPGFQRAFDDAIEAGVEVYPMKLHSEGDELILDGLLPVCGNS
jgi:sugar fermentation stimulation protein A